MANKITTVIDFVTTGAQRSVKTFRQSISEADGAVSKFKAGASSAMSAVSANLGNLALAGGAAAVALGTKVVAAFQATALEAGKLADATGLTVEAASRLREVSADLGVSGETVTMIVKKLNVELGKGNPLLEQYGIQLQRTSDGAADVNATLLDAIKRIQAIKDPTERAAAAQAAFGRGFADAAELIGTNADELKAKLDSVSDAKVITPEELKRARDFRDTMEELKDVGEDLATSSGQVLVPALTSVGEILLGIEAAAIKAKDAIEDIPGGRDFLETALSGIPDIVDQFQENARNLGEGLGLISENTDGATTSFERFKEIVGTAVTPTGELGDAVEETVPKIQSADQAWQNYVNSLNAEGVPGTFEDMQRAAEDALGAVEDGSDDAARALGFVADAASAVGDELNDTFDSFEDDLDQLDRLDGIADQFDEVADSSEKSARQQAADIRRLRELIGGYLRDLDGIPPDKKTEILADIRNADVGRLKGILDDLTKDRFINIGVNPASTAGFQSANFAIDPRAGTGALSFQGVQSAIPSQNITVIYPVGTTATSQFQLAELDARRNGTRNPNLQ